MKYDPELHHRESIRLRGYDYAQAGHYFVTICVQRRECLLGEVIDGEMRLNRFGQVAQSSWEELPRRFAGIELDQFVVMPNHIHGIIILAGDHAPTIGAQLIAPDFPSPVGEQSIASCAPSPVGAQFIAPKDTNACREGVIESRPYTRQSTTPEAESTAPKDPVPVEAQSPAPDIPSPVGAQPIASSTPSPVGAQFIAPKDTNVGRERVIESRPYTRQSTTPGAVLGEIVRTFKALTSRRLHSSGATKFAWQRNYYEHVIRNGQSLREIREYIATNPLKWELDQLHPNNPSKW